MSDSDMEKRTEDLGQKIMAEVVEFYKVHGYLPRHEIFDPEGQWDIEATKSKRHVDCGYRSFIGDDSPQPHCCHKDNANKPCVKSLCPRTEDKIINKMTELEDKNKRLERLCNGRAYIDIPHFIQDMHSVFNKALGKAIIKGGGPGGGRLGSYTFEPWKTFTKDRLIERFKEEYKEFWDATLISEAQGELLDIINMAAFLYLKYSGMSEED